MFDVWQIYTLGSLSRPPPPPRGLRLLLGSNPGAFACYTYINHVLLSHYSHLAYIIMFNDAGII